MSRKTLGAAHIGTSGWQYPDFRRLFYPEDLPHAELLGYYSRHFDTTEVNSTFYHFSRPSTYANWRDRTGGGFQVSVKAHRSFTHDFRLEDPDRQGKFTAFFETARTLGAKLGPVLFQLPASFKADVPRLKAFLSALPEPGLLGDARPRITIEFRDPSWWTPAALRALEKENVAFCIHDIRERTSPLEATADFVYVRLHGPLRSPYKGSYGPERLDEWAGHVDEWRRWGRDVYVYFDNTIDGAAILDARELSDRVERLATGRARRRAA